DAVFPPLALGDKVGECIAYGRGLEGMGKPDPRFIRPDGRPFEALPVTQSITGPTTRAGELAAHNPVPPSAGSLDGRSVAPWGCVMLDPAGSLVLDTDANGTPE